MCAGNLAVFQEFLACVKPARKSMPVNELNQCVAYLIAIQKVISSHCHFGWKADRPFSGVDFGKQTFVHLMGRGANRPLLVGFRSGRFGAPSNITGRSFRLNR